MSVFTITSVAFTDTRIDIHVKCDNSTITSDVFDAGGYEVSAVVKRNGTTVANSNVNPTITSATPTIQNVTVQVGIPTGTLFYGMLYGITVSDDTGMIPDTANGVYKTMAEIIGGGNQFKYVGHFTEPGTDALPFEVTGSAGTQAEALDEFTGKLALIPTNCTLVSVSAVAPPSSADNTAIAAVTRPASGPYQTMKLTVRTTLHGFKSTKVINITNAAKSFGVAGGRVDGNATEIGTLITAYRDGNNNGTYAFYSGVYTHR